MVLGQPFQYRVLIVAQLRFLESGGVSALPRLRVVDVGAMLLSEAEEVWQPLQRRNHCESVVGFEPCQEECDRLNAEMGNSQEWLAVLAVCREFGPKEKRESSHILFFLERKVEGGCLAPAFLFVVGPNAQGLEVIAPCSGGRVCRLQLHHLPIPPLGVG